MDPADHRHIDEGEQPPLFRTWSGWYILVLGTLAAAMLLLYLFMRAFS